ncbi:MAG: AAA family ATPase [Muribaculaceae bacterium]|nr:AAA family ATPase [Muribaculaceae bacterium]
MTDFAAGIFNSLSDELRATPQPDKWHGEGDVYTHTNMVCDALRSMPDYQKLPETQQDLLLAAAQLHDIGKIPTTRQILGQTEAQHHAPVGSRMARERLWLAGMCGSAELIARRETICRLIRYHSFPPHAIESDDASRRLLRIASASRLLPDFSLRLLCILAKADMLGRICDDKSQMLDNIALCEELAGEENCLDSCFPFPSRYTERAYLSGRDVWKDQMLYDDTWGTVYLMSGLPGTGKDTWIHKNLPDIPMISLDEIRRQQKISPTKSQGIVANLAKERSKEYLRRHQSFVWNATNITHTMRQQLVSLFESYKAGVHIIYLETGWQTLLERNASREDAVPRSAIEAMLGKLELPEVHEAAQLDWISV